MMMTLRVGMMMEFFSTTFHGFYASDLHQNWYTYSLYIHLDVDFDFFFFENRPLSLLLSLLSILWALEKFRVRGATGSYNFYVGLRLHLVCSLEVA